MIRPTEDPRVWNSVRWLYIGSGVLFLANILLGVANVFSGDTIPRGQVLAHFHAGTIGWITLSVIATALWVYTGNRPVSPNYALFTEIVTVLGLVSVAGYVMAFGAAFNGVAPFWLLPLFGIPTWLIILTAFFFILTQLKHQAVLTTVHLLLFGALLVASLGATMGVIWGLNLADIVSPYPSGEGVDPIAAHAAPMDMYLALAFAAIAELFLRKDDHQRWTKPGMWQMILGVVAAFLISIGAFVGALAVAPIALLLFLLTFLFYFVRVGWRALALNPFGGGNKPALFFGGLFYPIYILLFVTLVMVYFIPGEPMPHWLGIVFAHTTFIGMGTNFLLATHAAYGGHPDVHRALEPWAYWILNVGMLLFFAGEYAAEDRNAALIMAVGVLLALYVAWSRLGRSWERDGDEPPRPVETAPPEPEVAPGSPPSPPPDSPPDAPPSDPNP